MIPRRAGADGTQHVDAVRVIVSRPDVKVATYQPGNGIAIPVPVVSVHISMR